MALTLPTAVPRPDCSEAPRTENEAIPTPNESWPLLPTGAAVIAAQSTTEAAVADSDGGIIMKKLKVMRQLNMEAEIDINVD